MKKLSISLLTLFLCSCATTRHAEPSSNVPNATITFKSDAINKITNNYFFAYTSPSCAPSEGQGMIAVLAPIFGRESTKKIAANTKTFIVGDYQTHHAGFGTTQIITCRSFGSFTPENGGHYIAEVVSTASSCKLTIKDVKSAQIASSFESLPVPESCNLNSKK